MRIQHARKKPRTLPAAHRLGVSEIPASKVVADRLAEVFAEYLHERVRKVIWGFAAHENLSNDELSRENYQGIRPAPGYPACPACPEHTEKAAIWQLLDVEAHTSMKLTESFAMWPGASVSGWYFQSSR